VGGENTTYVNRYEENLYACFDDAGFDEIIPDFPFSL
jgi:hypothetical protein